MARIAIVITDTPRDGGYDIDLIPYGDEDQEIDIHNPTPAIKAAMDMSSLWMHYQKSLGANLTEQSGIMVDAGVVPVL